MKQANIINLLNAGKTVTFVELRAVEAGKFDANPAKNKPESHFLKYAVLRGNESAELTQYAPKGATTAPAPLKFKKGDMAVVVGDFERTDYGLRGRAETIELLEA